MSKTTKEFYTDEKVTHNKRKLTYFVFTTIAIIVLLATVFIVIIFTPAKTNYDYGNTSKYSKEEINIGFDLVKGNLKALEDKWPIKIYSIKYLGDKDPYSSEEKPNNAPKQMYFETTFRSPMFGIGAWEANSIYVWTYEITKDKDGNWIITGFGEA